MLSEDLRSLREVIARRVAMFDGQVFLDATQAAAVVNLLDDLAAQAERLEQHTVPAAARTLPPGVTNLAAARRRKAAAVPRGTPGAGGAA